MAVTNKTWWKRTGLNPRQWIGIRRAVLDRDGYRCRLCGRAGRFEIHHLTPVAAGGGNELENLATLCRHCHLEIHRPERKPELRAWDELIQECLST